MRIASKASRTAFLTATAAAVVLVATLSNDGVSATTLASGKPLQVADESYEGNIQEVARPPLSAGIVTRPLGAGNVFGGKLPDIFVANTKESTHPGLFLFQYVSTDSEGKDSMKSHFHGLKSKSPRRVKRTCEATRPVTTDRFASVSQSGPSTG